MGILYCIRKRGNEGESDKKRTLEDWSLLKGRGNYKVTAIRN